MARKAAEFAKKITEASASGKRLLAEVASGKRVADKVAGKRIAENIVAATRVAAHLSEGEGKSTRRLAEESGKRVAEEVASFQRIAEGEGKSTRRRVMQVKFISNRAKSQSMKAETSAEEKKAWYEEAEEKKRDPADTD